MYVISSLIMHENPKVSSLYRQDFAVKISVLVERICEIIGTVGNGAKEHRAMARGCLESSVLDEVQYHVQKFEEAGKEADEEERRKVEDGLLGMERIEAYFYGRRRRKRRKKKRRSR